MKNITNFHKPSLNNPIVLVEAVAAAAPKKGKAAALSQPVVQSAQIVAVPDKK